MFLRCLSRLTALLAIILAGRRLFRRGSGDKLVLPDRFKPMLPLHTKLGKLLPGDWLIAHPEPGQTYAEYVRSRPVRPDRRRRVITCSRWAISTRPAEDPRRGGGVPRHLFPIAGESQGTHVARRDSRQGRARIRPTA